MSFYAEVYMFKEESIGLFLTLHSKIAPITFSALDFSSKYGKHGSFHTTFAVLADEFVFEQSAISFWKLHHFTFIL